jgi:hypothetical protein
MGYLSDAFLVDVGATYDISVAAAWLSGTEEVFIQLINWVIDGAIPVDYHRRLTGITLLMAAGNDPDHFSGYSEMLELRDVISNHPKMKEKVPVLHSCLKSTKNNRLF